jgi:fructuronate reductase
VSPQRLSIATLPGRLPGGSTGPRGADPTAMTIGIVHFGIGAFHRSHQAVFTEDAAAATGDTGWGILGVTGRTDAVVEQLRPQDCLYGVLEKDRAETSLRIVGSVREVAFPGRDSVRVVEVLASPTTQIATLTITEKGYLRAQDGAIDLGLASVQHDIRIVERELSGEEPSEPSETAIGLLVRGLAGRFRLNGEPFTVLCCDNLIDNGSMVKRVVFSLAAAIGSGDPAATSARDRFLDWLGESVAFPSSMVDRITPAVTESDREEALALLGLRDDALVVAEPFSQWVIEDRFAGRRPAWELAGVTITDDVAPFENAKLRILNSTHSLLAYLGQLKGHQTIADAVADDALLRVAGRVLDDDILPTLVEPPGLDLRQYRDTVLERIGNPALAHTTRQVGMDGSQKLPNRIIGVAVERLAAGELPLGLALAIAAWIRYIASTMKDGAAPLDDPMADTLTAAIGSADAPDTDPTGVVDRMFAITAVFPAELAASVAFRDAVAAQLDEVRRLTAPSQVLNG